MYEVWVWRRDSIDKAARYHCEHRGNTFWTAVWAARKAFKKYNKVKLRMRRY